MTHTLSDTLIKRFFREPLVYFLLAGLAIFIVSNLTAGDVREPILVSEAEQQRLADQWRASMGQDPTPAELEGLIEQWIREEIYYREAMTMGLDENDVIIRRRLAQKLTFFTEDVATGGDADQAEIRKYYDEHAERYTEPARYTFSHRYFSRDRRLQPEADASQVLAAADGSEPAEGDAFMLQSSYMDQSRPQIETMFGSVFAAAVPDLAVGEWQGPLPSAYGWHLVKVERQHPARRLEFNEVARRVASDFKQEQRREANEAFYKSLRARYEVVRP